MVIGSIGLDCCVLSDCGLHWFASCGLVNGGGVVIGPAVERGAVVGVSNIDMVAGLNRCWNCSGNCASTAINAAGTEDTEDEHAWRNFGEVRQSKGRSKGSLAAESPRTVLKGQDRWKERWLGIDQVCSEGIVASFTLTPSLLKHVLASPLFKCRLRCENSKFHCWGGP